jgi:hypothetical protein
MDFSTEGDKLFLHGNFGNLHYFTANLNDSLTPERMIEIWEKFENKCEIHLDKMVEYLHKNNELIHGPMTWYIILEMLYLLEECSSINGFDERLKNKEELVQKIKSIIKKLEKSSIDRQKQEKKILELYKIARSLVSELKMVYILVKNNFDIKLIDRKNKRPDVEFIKNGFTADFKYSFPYKFSNLSGNSFYTYEEIIRNILITAKHYRRKDDFEKADIIFINCSELYFQNIFLGFTNDYCQAFEPQYVALPVKDAIERAFEIVNSGEKAIVLFKLPMPFSPREGDAREVLALAKGESSVSFVKSSEPRVHEIKPTKS